MENNKVLFTEAEVGKMFGIGKPKVYELIRNGYLPALNLGGLKIKKSTIDEFLTAYENCDFSDMKNIVELVA